MRTAIGSEVDMHCPICGERMETLRAENIHAGLPDGLRVCPVCATLAWNDEQGRVRTRRPSAVVH